MEPLEHVEQEYEARFYSNSTEQSKSNNSKDIQMHIRAREGKGKSNTRRHKDLFSEVRPLPRSAYVSVEVAPTSRVSLDHFPHSTI